MGREPEDGGAGFGIGISGRAGRDGDCDRAGEEAGNLNDG